MILPDWESHKVNGIITINYNNDIIINIIVVAKLQLVTEYVLYFKVLYENTLSMVLMINIMIIMINY